MADHDGDRADVPDWDDAYLSQMRDRLKYNYDLAKNYRARGERFDMYGHLRVESQKQFFHPALNYANYETEEHCYVRRIDSVSVPDLKGLVDLGHELADEQITPSEEHYGTEFSFVLVVPEIPASVREFVSEFRDRTMLKYGYYGDYEIHLVVVAPEHEQLVASQNADVATAFALWNDVGDERPGLLGRLLGVLQS